MTTESLCPRCHAPIHAGTRFCAQCGQDITLEQGVVATAAVPKGSMTSITELAEAEMLDALRQATLGEYEIKGELGRGGMAIVYLAHDISLDRKVAIKVMLPTMIRGQGMVERFKREARTAASLSHPHIIPIHAVKETDRILFFVMKFVSGRGLDSVIDKLDQLPIEMVTTILSQVGSALGYAHRQGVIHRDIKPANIIIDEEGWAVVTDFGIAKIADAENLTASGAAVGTPTYMSPEQCSGKELTGASDQYSLGIVAYEMLTGAQPFRGDSIMEIMKQHFFDMPEPIEAARHDCPPALREIVLRMLVKEPEARWGSLEECVSAIGAAPLKADDPVRTQMVQLAQSAAAELQVTKLKTPRSPMPAMRSGVKTRPSAATEMMPESNPELVAQHTGGAGTSTIPPTGESRVKKRSKAWIVALPLMFIAAGGGAWAALNWDKLSEALGIGETITSGEEAPPEVLAAAGDSDPVAGAAGDSTPAAPGGTEVPPVLGTAAQDTTSPGEAGTEVVSEPSPEPEPVVPPPPAEGVIRLTGVPTGAAITLDRRRVGRGPYTLEAGPHVIEIVAAGFENFQWQGDLPADGDITLRYDAAAIAPEPEPEPVAPPARAVLLLQTRPAIAEVTFDGVTLTRSGRNIEHVFSPDLPHLLRITAPGYATTDTTITVAPGDTLRLRITLTSN